MSKKSPHKLSKTGKTFLTIFLMVFIVAASVYLDTFHGDGHIKKYFMEMSVNHTESSSKASGLMEDIPLDTGSQASFAVNGQSYLLCTKDGVKYFHSTGEQRWSDTFTMTTPQLIQEGAFMAVGDMSGKDIRVYDENGLCYHVQLEGIPVQFALNENGYLSVIEKQEGICKIYIYNKAGKLLKARVEESQGIYPVSTDISDDNKSFAISYVDTTDVQLMGHVLFFYINSKDSENYTDSMYASTDVPDEILGTVSYGDNGLRVVSDRGLYGLQNNGIKRWKYSFSNMVEYISFQNKDRVVVAYGQKTAGSDGRAVGTVSCIDNSGKEKASYETGANVTYLSAWEDGIIAGNEKNYTGIRYTGRESWRYHATKDTQALIPMEKFTKILVVMQDSAMILDMTKRTNGADMLHKKELPNEEKGKETKDETEKTEKDQMMKKEETQVQKSDKEGTLKNKQEENFPKKKEIAEDIEEKGKQEDSEKNSNKDDLKKADEIQETNREN